MTATNGRLSAKIQRHDNRSTTTPPASGPMIEAIPPHAVQAPIAPPRAFGAKPATMIASDAGVMSAPAAPWSARAAIRTPIVGASAHRSETTPKAPIPTAKIRRSP